jgi:hypothetical protein
VIASHPYPTFICHECGMKYGRHAPGICTCHEGTCDVCGKVASLTEPRDYGHLVLPFTTEPDTEVKV